MFEPLSHKPNHRRQAQGTPAQPWLRPIPCLKSPWVVTVAALGVGPTCILGSPPSICDVSSPPALPRNGMGAVLFSLSHAVFLIAVVTSVVPHPLPNRSIAHRHPRRLYRAPIIIMAIRQSDQVCCPSTRIDALGTWASNLPFLSTSHCSPISIARGY